MVLSATAVTFTLILVPHGADQCAIMGKDVSYVNVTPTTINVTPRPF